MRTSYPPLPQLRWASVGSFCWGRELLGSRPFKSSSRRFGEVMFWNSVCQETYSRRSRRRGWPSARHPGWSPARQHVQEGRGRRAPSFACGLFSSSTRTYATFGLGRSPAFSMISGTMDSHAMAITCTQAAPSIRLISSSGTIIPGAVCMYFRALSLLAGVTPARMKTYRGRGPVAGGANVPPDGQGRHHLPAGRHSRRNRRAARRRRRRQPTRLK